MRYLLQSMAVLGLAATSGAQSLNVTVPNYHANTDAARQSTFPFGYTAGRTQQVIHGDQVAKTVGLINEFAYRQDMWLSPAAQAPNIARVIVTMGHTMAQPGSMSLDFAANRTGEMTMVYDASLNLPAPGAGSPRPFDIKFKLNAPFLYLPAQGNMLLELEIPGKATRTSYVIDAAVAVASGVSSKFGSQGSFAMGDKLSFNNLKDTELRPGGMIEVGASGLKNLYAAVTVFGFSKTKFGGLSLPFDLSVLGAPNNRLYASMDLVLPLPLHGMFVGYGGSTKLPIPKIAGLEGTQIFSQSLYLDRKANQLGLVFSDRLDMTLGSGLLYTQQIVNQDSTSTKGIHPPEALGNVIQFTGVFN